MSETTDIATARQPLLIVVTGPPGSGKTSLTPALARAIRCPAICRDEIKEGLINTIGETGEPGGDLARRANDAFFETVKLLLTRGVTLIAEAAFQHKLWAPGLEPLRAIALLRIIVCTVDADLARQRYAARALADPARQRYHPDRDLPSGDYDPPRLDVPTLMVDTSEGYRPPFDTIVSFAGQVT